MRCVWSLLLIMNQSPSQLGFAGLGNIIQSSDLNLYNMNVANSNM